MCHWSLQLEQPKLWESNRTPCHVQTLQKLVLPVCWIKRASQFTRASTQPSSFTRVYWFQAQALVQLRATPMQMGITTNNVRLEQDVTHPQEQTVAVAVLVSVLVVKPSRWIQQS